MMIDSRLNTFLVLYETMNYRKAAEKLHITQPAVTQHIKHLEKEYSCRLFEYNGRSLKRTKAAEIMKQYTEKAVYQEKKMRQALKSDSGFHLKIGATKTIGGYMLSDCVNRFLEDSRNTLSIEVGNTAEMLALLDDGKLDFTIIEGFFPKNDYGHKLFRKEKFAGICSREHPFAGRTVDLGMIFSEHLICRELHSGTRAVLEQVLNEENHRIEDFAHVTNIGNFGLLTSLVASGTGISFAYEAVYRGHPELASFTVKGWRIVHELNYVFLKDTDAASLVEVFDSCR